MQTERRYAPSLHELVPGSDEVNTRQIGPGRYHPGGKLVSPCIRRHDVYVARFEAPDKVVSERVRS